MAKDNKPLEKAIEAQVWERELDNLAQLVRDLADGISTENATEKRDPSNPTQGET